MIFLFFYLYWIFQTYTVLQHILYCIAIEAIIKQETLDIYTMNLIVDRCFPLPSTLTVFIAALFVSDIM